MPGYSIPVANQALNAVDATGTPVNHATHVNLNTADPGTTGASEATSNRQACSWNAAAARAKTNASALTFTGQAAGTAHGWFSTWSALTAGVFGISGALGSSVTAATITVAAGALSLSA